MRRSKSLLYDYMHIGSCIEETPADAKAKRRKSITSIIKENKDLINELDAFQTCVVSCSRLSVARRRRPDPSLCAVVGRDIRRA